MPKGRAADQRRMLWLVQAAAPPEFEVYQLEHADILITAVPKKTKPIGPARPDVQASAKTIAALSRPVESAHETGLTDPWHLGVTDPWAHYTPPAKVLMLLRSR